VGAFLFSNHSAFQITERYNGRRLPSIMIPSLRKQFNANFTREKYQAFLRRIDELSGTHVEFRLS
jgi:hypothetical protein